MATWRNVSAQPTSPEAVADRQRELDRVIAAGSTTREAMVRSACRGMGVLDIGCVDHDERLVDTPGWLHGQLHEVAESVVGLDIHAAGVERMQELGYEAYVADITVPAPEHLRDRHVDVVVAGELIEHLESPMSLLRFAGGCPGSRGS